MGGSTFAIGLVPSYASIGFAAPLIVLVLRLLQGLALGGEYGGAATYVAEHAPAAQRGFYTSFIQTTASLGLFVSLGVILAVRHYIGVAEFAAWGWRIPFLLSALLVGVSVIIRLKMNESPMFSKLKSEGKTSVNPIKESFTNKENLRMVLIALFGVTAGQGVVWYTGQFYAMTFLEKTCKIEFVQTRNIICYALMIGTPLFIYFGWLSDRMGRKIIMMLGLLLAVFLYRPIYKHMYATADLSQKEEITSKVSVAESDELLETGEKVHLVKTTHVYTDSTRMVETVQSKHLSTGAVQVEKRTEVILAGELYYGMIGMVLIQVVLVTMVYGPIAAFLVEIFPTRIRYTSMSLPYHIGNGIFGGLTPFIATWLFDRSKAQHSDGSGDPLVGLWYPIIVAAVSVIIGMIFLKNRTRGEVME
jgi:MHS family proline/betaine transporter-like MFS transporter